VWWEGGGLGRGEVGVGGGGWEFIGMTELNKWTPSIRPIRDNNRASNCNSAKLQYFNSVAHYTLHAVNSLFFGIFRTWLDITNHLIDLILSVHTEYNLVHTDV
jgi:hypothetical protein